MEKQHDEDELRMQGLAAESARFKKEAERMKARMLELDEGNAGMHKLMEQLHLRCSQAEAAGASAQEVGDQVRQPWLINHD